MLQLLHNPSKLHTTNSVWLFPKAPFDKQINGTLKLQGESYLCFQTYFNEKQATEKVRNFRMPQSLIQEQGIAASKPCSVIQET